MHDCKTLLLHNIVGIFQHTQTSCSHRKPRKHEQRRQASHRVNQTPLRSVPVCQTGAYTHISWFGKLNFLCEQLGGDRHQTDARKATVLLWSNSRQHSWTLPSLPSLTQSLNGTGCARALLQAPGNTSSPKAVS